MDDLGVTSATWTYEKADQLPGSDLVTLYFHETKNFTVQTKVTVADPVTAVAWAAERGFPDPSGGLDFTVSDAADAAVARGSGLNRPG